LLAGAWQFGGQVDLVVADGRARYLLVLVLHLCIININSIIIIIITTAITNIIISIITAIIIIDVVGCGCSCGSCCLMFAPEHNTVQSAYPMIASFQGHSQSHHIVHIVYFCCVYILMRFT